MAYLGSAVGFPLPLPAGKDTSTPFPCQGHLCGCHSAEQCWENCCCFTSAERLAWARRHGVELPHDVQVALAAETHNDTETHEHEHEHAGGACCRTDTHKAADDDCDHCQTDGGTQVVFIYGFQAQKCQGLTMLWVTGGCTLPPTAGPTWQFDWLPAGRVCPREHPFSSIVSTPPVPPPRLCAQSAASC